jgi:peptidoglycan hydrolase-like protein with peptidoglycan-binding domain
MALQSTLLRGDTQLEAAAVSDAAHIVPGARGGHVAKLQRALNELDDAALAEDGVYGPGTAAAVLAFKRARDIVNRSYQTQADNIVGKMTLAALDRELLASGPPTVILGRIGFRPRLAFSFGLPLPQQTAQVAAIVRGNPFVRANAPDIGLPPSVPPGHAYEVPVTIVPPLSGTDFVELEIINVDSRSGNAVVSPAKLQTSGIVTVLGSRQTEPGSAGSLRLQASFNGKMLAQTAGFTVCAHPTSVTAESIAFDVDEGAGVGMMVKEALGSDSGAPSHLDRVQWSELVDPIKRDDPPFGTGSGFVNNSGYKPAVPPPGLSIVDRHVEPRPSAGPKGESLKVQVHMFKCARCGAEDIPIPASGFEILHEVTLVGREFKHKVTKQPLATGVRDPVSKKIIKAKGGIGKLVSRPHAPGPK